MNQSPSPVAILVKTASFAAIAGALMYLGVRVAADEDSVATARQEERAAMERRTRPRQAKPAKVELWYGDQKVNSYAEVKALREATDRDAALATLYENTKRHLDAQHRMLREDFQRNKHDPLPDDEVGVTLADLDRIETQGLMIQ